MGADSKDDSEPAAHAAARQAFDQLVVRLRPQLHRYCARMTGSAVDGEDVVQETLLKAIEAVSHAGTLTNAEGWLFRIAHNAALDFLRSRSRREAIHSDEDPEMIAAQSIPPPDRQIVSAGLRTFMRLPVVQRGAVILRDVLGYSVDEVCGILGGSVPAIKGALRRGRSRLQELAQEPDDTPPPDLGEPERSRLLNYVERFNLRDFDSVRDMLAEDVRLDLVNRLAAKGRSEVGQYFHKYALASPWHCVPGFVDRRPAMLMFDPNDPGGSPAYFILLEWRDDKVARIQDFHFARYALEGAELFVLGAPGSRSTVDIPDA